MKDEKRPSILLNPDEVGQALDRLAEGVLRWWDGLGDRPLRLIGVLEGARPLTRDLAARLKSARPQAKLHEHFVRSHGTQGLALLSGRELALEGWDWQSLDSDPVLILDDLLDSGKTLQALQAAARARLKSAPKTAVLIRKYADCPFQTDFCGFDWALRREDLRALNLKDRWLYGYGMDLEGRHRELDYVAWQDVR